MPEPFEIVIYIHGVSNDLHGRPHQDEYDAIHTGIRSKNSLFPEDFTGVEWGWHAPDQQGHSHQLLSDAQRELGGRVTAAVERSSDFTFNVTRLMVNGLRPIVFYGFGDMFYYVSADGKQAVREAVAAQITDRLDACGCDDPASLTLVGHSAGSVVAFDFLYFLFAEREHEFLKPGETPDPVLDRCYSLRQKAKDGMLRVRRLVTFGSPIAMMACRSDAVVDILSRGERLDAADCGFAQDPFGGLSGPRWINLWDKDDPIAFPVESLMTGAGDLVPFPVHDFRVHNTQAARRR